MSPSKWDEDLPPDSTAYQFAISESRICRSLAGPGTGKTFSLMRKVAYLLDTGADPKSILILTFTRAGAADIRRELAELGVDGVENIRASTLHSFCMSVLRHNDVINMLYRTPRTLYNYEKDVMLNDIKMDGDDRFGNIHQKRKRLTAYEGAWARLQLDNPGIPQSEDDAEFLRRIRRWMKYHKAMTIGEIVPFTLQFIDANPAFSGYRDFDYVLVDEYQDLNKAEQVVIDRIAQDACFTIVGDDNQSIYGFKNAHPEGIRQFAVSHESCEDIPMRECRRCPKQVVSIADDLIKRDPRYNSSRKPILIPHHSNGDGEVSVLQWNSYEDEAIGLAQIIKLVLEQNPSALTPKDVLVLNTTKSIAKLINDNLVSLGVSSHFVAKNDDLLFGDDTAKSFHSFLTCLANNQDYVSLRFHLRWRNNLYSEKYMQLLTYSESHDLSLVEVLQGVVCGIVDIPGITLRTALIKRYLELQEKLALWRKINTVEGFLEKATEECGEEAQYLLENIVSICQNISIPETVENIPTYIAQQITGKIHDFIISFEDTTNDDKVRVMTCHSAKGLSGKLVIVSSCIEDFFLGYQKTKMIS